MLECARDEQRTYSRQVDDYKQTTNTLAGWWKVQPFLARLSALSRREEY
jgi:hypothetical protein